MANRVRVRVTGLKELRRAMQLYGQRLVQASLEAVTDATEDTVIKARFLAPVGAYPPGATTRAGNPRRPGTLRDSIRGSVTATPYGARGTVRATAPHAHLVEFGTVRADAKPFLVPAAIGNRRRLNRQLTQAVRTHAPEALGRPRITGEGPSLPELSND